MLFHFVTISRAPLHFRKWLKCDRILILLLNKVWSISILNHAMGESEWWKPTTMNIALSSGMGKGRYLTQSYNKSPFTNRKIQKITWQHKNATKNSDYSTIVDRLRTDSWSYDSHPTGVIKLVYGIPIFPLATRCVIKWHTSKICK